MQIVRLQLYNITLQLTVVRNANECFFGIKVSHTVKLFLPYLDSFYFMEWIVDGQKKEASSKPLLIFIKMN